MSISLSSSLPPGLEIVKEDVELPEKAKAKGQLAFVLHNVLSPKECEELIKATEKIGYDVAQVNVGFGRQVTMTDVRNSKRCIVDSFDYTGALWERIKEFIPPVFCYRKVIGLNERMRCLRYDPGEYFKPHFDGEYRRPNGERSLITFHLYLNESFEGGATTFLDANFTPYPVIPKTGSVLIFEHNIFHEGSNLISGRKYTVRTDVMFSAVRVDNS